MFSSDDDDDDDDDRLLLFVLLLRPARARDEDNELDELDELFIR